MIQEHDTVVVNRDLKELGLVAGDIGAVVHVYEGKDMAEVEFVTGEGSTIAVVTLSFTEIRPITGDGLISGPARKAWYELAAQVSPARPSQSLSESRRMRTLYGLRQLLWV